MFKNAEKFQTKYNVGNTPMLYFFNEPLTDMNLYQAVDLWFKDKDKAERIYGNIEDWNTSAVTNMSNLFKGRQKFNENLHFWDTSNVTNMSHMFMNAKPCSCDIECWEVSKVKVFDNIF